MLDEVRDKVLKHAQVSIVTRVVQNGPKVTLLADLLCSGVARLGQQLLELVDTPLSGAVIQLHFLADGVLLGHETLPAGRRVLL